MLNVCVRVCTVSCVHLLKRITGALVTHSQSAVYSTSVFTKALALYRVKSRARDMNRENGIPTHESRLSYSTQQHLTYCTMYTLRFFSDSQTHVECFCELKLKLMLKRFSHASTVLETKSILSTCPSVNLLDCFPSHYSDSVIIFISHQQLGIKTCTPYVLYKCSRVSSVTVFTSNVTRVQIAAISAMFSLMISCEQLLSVDCVVLVS